MKMQSWRSLPVCLCLASSLLLGSGCGSGDSEPAKTGELSEEEVQQVQELNEQRQSEWGTQSK